MDEQVLNTNEALKILKKHYITDDIQMVTRFIRSERLKAEKDTRKNGYRIRESDLYDFIEEEKPGMVEVMYIYEKYIEQLTVNSNPEKYIQAILANKNVADKQEESSLPGSEEDSTHETPVITIAQPVVNQKIDQAALTVSEQVPTELSDDWIKEFLKHPSFQSALSEIVKQLNIESNINSSKKPKSTKKEEKSASVNSYKFKTLEQFLNILREKKTGQKILRLWTTEQIEYLYNLYYENGQMREGLYNNEKETSVFICPVTHKENNQLLHLLAKTLPDIVKQMDKDLESKPESDKSSDGSRVGQTNTEEESEITSHILHVDSAVPSDGNSPDTPDEDEKD